MEGRHLQVCDGLREQLAKEKEVGSERDRELMVMKDERIAAEQKFQQVTGELTSVNEKLREVTARNDELEAMKINDSSSAGEVQCHLLELQGKYNEVKEELRAAQLSVESKSSKIAQLESTIEKINEQHDGRMKQLQESSAAEKSAVNSQNAELLSRLENQLQSVQQDLENAREELKVAHVKMEGMESLQTKEATEDNHAREVAMFKNKINTLESRLRDNEVELESKLEETGALRRELSVVKGENEDLSMELCNTKEELEEYCDQFESLERKLVHENFVLNEIRRKLHNRVIQLSGNIRVFVRVRPLIESEKIDLTKQTIELTEPYKDRGGLNPRQKKYRFGFDRVYNPTNDQEDVWEGAQPLVQSAIDGFDVCMFAYGQTGSGKTHTMIGDEANRGLIPRAVEMIFANKREIESKSDGDITVKVGVELLEIYNEEVRDLLSNESGSDGKLVKINVNGHEAVGNILATAESKEDIEGILNIAQKRRCVKATKSNSESSRSHLLFTIHFDVSSTTREGVDRNGVLHIIDLAGSERLNKSGSHGALLTEAQHINKSLSALSLVIEKLQAKSEHIPFRDSKLTYLLRNSLGGDSKTLAIVCCSSHQVHFQESMNSIRFAAKASKVELKEGNQISV
ncbi:predicted protein [Thalassiosira pseudonana CCMP1335]|uniref:Kinesin-like protein n=1 Tax=Thalassiosira pseudonana TaxID=35128 RepID=B8LCA2_THAPS|nr:predicted protein [Thalassiosira pseudonana CCMP1335]EED87058.1 predicted protein [Thalassiosira pseudonana CCMP1335]